MRLAIMQGRLVPPEDGRFQSFPRQRWREEFGLASAAGIDAIEWIYDAYGEDTNPIASERGRTEVISLRGTHGVEVRSVCADWFMDYPLVGADWYTTQERWTRLAWLIGACVPLQIERLVIPFVDASAIRNADDVNAVAVGINSLAELISNTKVELHLETALTPFDFAALLAKVPNPGVKVNYDSGNSASLGYQPQEEFAAYGERVGSVHLKDRCLGAGTVPLGEGDTDFDALFDALKKYDYCGDFVLQVARGLEGDELAWARKNVLFAQNYMRRLSSS